jgi:hypothetical protein
MDGPFPTIQSDLLKALDNTFPLRLPKITDKKVDIGVLIGERKVIDFLKRHFEEQNENILTR